MSIEEKWPIGTLVSFEHDMPVSGKVIAYFDSQIVCLLLDDPPLGLGWVGKWNSRLVPRQYHNLKCYNVKGTKLKRSITALGNSYE